MPALKTEIKSSQRNIPKECKTLAKSCTQCTDRGSLALYGDLHSVLFISVIAQMLNQVLFLAVLRFHNVLKESVFYSRFPIKLTPEHRRYLRCPTYSLLLRWLSFKFLAWLFSTTFNIVSFLVSYRSTEAMLDDAFVIKISMSYN